MEDSAAASESRWEEFTDEFFSRHFAASPTAAVWAGLHEYDGQLQDVSAEAIQRRTEMLREYALTGQRTNFPPIRSLRLRNWSASSWYRPLRACYSVWRWPSIICKTRPGMQVHSAQACTYRASTLRRRSDSRSADGPFAEDPGVHRADARHASAAFFRDPLCALPWFNSGAWRPTCKTTLRVCSPMLRTRTCRRHLPTLLGRP